MSHLGIVYSDKAVFCEFCNVVTKGFDVFTEPKISLQLEDGEVVFCKLPKPVVGDMFFVLKKY